MYKVLWIDDEHEKFDGFKELAAENYDLNLDNNSFDNYEDGLDWLRRNLQDCVAVILDVHCKANKNAAANVTSFSDNLMKDMLPFCLENNIPWFVYTAGSSQSEEFSQIEKWFLSRKAEWASKNYYHKPDDYKLLLEDIQKAISNSLRRQLEKKYSEIFEFVGHAKKENLLEVMLSIAIGNTRSTSHMNRMRQVLEWLTKYLVDYGFLPEGSGLSDLRHYMVSLNDVGLDDIIPKYIRYTMQTCENVTQEGSHDGTRDGIQVSKALEEGRAPYLIESTLNNLLTILYWGMLLPTDEKGKNELLNRINDHLTIEEGELKYNESSKYYFVNDCKLPYNANLANRKGNKTKIYNKTSNRDYTSDNDQPKYFSYNYDVTDEKYK